MEITVKQTVTPQRLSEMFISAIEGNYMTRAWCDSILATDEDAENFVVPDGMLQGCGWYANPAFFDRQDYQITVIHDGEDSEEGELNYTTVITPKDIAEGLQLMATKYPAHFADMMQETGDAITSDVMLQCIVLKDALFG